MRGRSPLAFVAALSLTTVALATPAAAAEPKPGFQAPYPCGQQIKVNADKPDGVGVFRPGNGWVYLDNNLDGVSDQKYQYGAPGDRPFSRKRG
jgi:hypothetical protein